MPKGFKFGERSRKNLAGVHPVMVALVKRAGELCEIDFYVDQGRRLQAEQDKLYAQGRTFEEIRAAGIHGINPQPGPIVTWTRKSKHLPSPKDGLARAVDLVPFPVDWKTLSKFDLIRDAMFSALEEYNSQRTSAAGPLVMRWGADWDMDGKHREKGESDNPHFEIVGGL